MLDQIRYGDMSVVKLSWNGLEYHPSTSC